MTSWELSPLGPGQMLVDTWFVSRSAVPASNPEEISVLDCGSTCGFDADSRPCSVALSCPGGVAVRVFSASRCLSWTSRSALRTGSGVGVLALA